MNSPQLNLGEKPKLIPISFKPTPQPQPKAKTRKTIEEEYEDLMTDVEKNQPKPKPKQKAKATASASASSASQAPPAPVKKAITKTKNVTTGTQIPPSKIGIQKLREELENAQNKNKLNVQDTSTHMKLYDDWKRARGDKATKDEK